MNLTIEQYNDICDTHQEESWWYLFLNYGDPLFGEVPEYAKLFEGLEKALTAYIEYMTTQRKLLGEERELYL